MKAPANLQQHALSAVFPPLSSAEFEALKVSIKRIGVQVPITVYDGQVIDGWYRYCAASELGVDCPAVALDDTEPRDFAISQTARRNLTASQIAMLISEIYKWQPAHRPVNSALRAELSPTAKQLARTFGVGVRSIERARAVQAHATPEVQAAVKNGEVGLPKAAAIAKQPREKQAAALKKTSPKPVQVSPSDEPADTGPDEDELAAQAAAEQADRETMQLLMDSDDKLATAVAEIKRLNGEVILLKRSRDAAMIRANELAQWVKRRDFQITKLNQEIAALSRRAA